MSSKNQNPDPGGSQEPSSRELSDLKDQNEQQLVLIAQLKEMLRKSDQQTNVTDDKVQEYVKTLSRKKKSKSTVDLSTTNIDSNKKEKLNLLKQQMEENKAKLAERGKSQKGLEEMVTQLTVQFNDSQQLISQSPLNLSIQDTKSLDYNENTPAKELYNILLNKEKKITELSGKVQKLEGNVLDLQENLKEKDSVIDARTKAITLMTESLSKKGKNTLDQLDETKEQMRKMQENFVRLEEEMRNRQLKLLEDLKLKNSEILDLQEEIAKGRSEVDSFELEELKRLNEDLLVKNQELVDGNNDWVVKYHTLLEQQQDSEEVSKLKKQLDESNKNMIKIKAQHKSKIKELTKKLDTFKKMNDSNALILQLQNEVSKLEQKIAELEDEKGNLQLKMVESTDSIKDNEIRELTEKIQTLTQVQNEKVQSEMSNIQFEEKLDLLEKERESIEEDRQKLVKENEELAEKLDIVTKEKTDLNVKLENYIQENMELIDKLEKLSAEKVSSAESIEIVEGLTQQEKLELAAYQQNLEQPAEELNESVMQLNEDSTELLQKIEMFNVERKEVMLKLDALREENLKLNEDLKEIKEENMQLALKLKEVENNRDVLEETYEQLQTEKEKLEQQYNQKNETGIEENLTEIQEKCNKLQEENNNLKKSLKELNEAIFEKEEELQRKLKRAEKENQEFDNKLKAHQEEIDNYKLIIEENKQELINSSQIINNMQLQLTEKEQQIKGDHEEIEGLNCKIVDLNTALQSLEKLQNNKNEELDVKVNENLEILEEQLNQLKQTLSLQLEQAQEYEKELSQNHEIITQLNSQLKELNNRLAYSQDQIVKKDEEIEKLSRDFTEQEKVVKDLQKTIVEKDAKFKELTSDLTEKFLKLQQQFEGNNESLESKINELQNKNKDLVEKLKKLAANLKKKTQDNVELQNVILKLKEEKETVLTLKQEFSEVQEQTDSAESLVAAKDVKIKELEMIIETQENDLSDYKGKISRLEEGLAILEERRQSLERTNVELGDKLMETSASFEEKSYEEEQLEQRLASILHKDELLTKRLDTVTLENEELTLKYQDLLEEQGKLNEIISGLQDQLAEALTAQNAIPELEQANSEYAKQLTTMEQQLKQMQQNSDLIKEQSKSEIDKYESEIQIQMDEMLAEKNEILVRNQKLEEQIQELTGILEEQQVKLSEDDTKITELNNLLLLSQDEIKVLKEELLKITASQVVDSVITEAKSQVASKENSPKHEENIVPIFTWTDNSQNSQQEGNSKEELQQKIKTLEFMLYSMEKEKDNALLQCHELSNELTRLVYEREKQPTSDLEAQILPADVTDHQDLKELQPLEFEAVQASQQSQGEVEVVEENIGKKVAYKCYKDGEDGGIPEDIQSTKPGSSAEGFVDDNDDGWGWGPEEAKKEEAHLMTTSTPENNTLKSQIENLTEQIRVYELERNQHLEEIKQLQIKSGKLIKKCKEFKLKYEQAKGGDSFNLDGAIQDELKAQVDNLEKSLREVTNELSREKGEKVNVLKQVDVLTAANEKLVDKMERLEIDLINARKQYEEVQQKLDTSEWDSFGGDKVVDDKGSGGESDDIRKCKKQVEELTDSLRDIMLDNEELQSLLEEQKTLREAAENKVKNMGVQRENVRSEEEYTVLLNLKNDLENQVRELQDKLKDMKTVEEYSMVLNLKNDLENQLRELQDNYSSVNNQLKDMKTVEEYSMVLNLKNDLENQLRELQNDNNEWARKYEEECQSKNDLQMRFMHIETNYENITRELSELRLQAEREKEILQQEIVVKNAECVTLTQEKSELEEKLRYLEEVLRELKDKMRDLNEQSKVLQNEYDNIQEKTRELEEVGILEGKVKDLDCQNKELWGRNLELEGIVEKLKNDIQVRDENIRELAKSAESNVGFGDYQALNQRLINSEIQRAELQDFKNQQSTASFFDNLQENSEVLQLKEKVQILYQENQQLKARSFFDNVQKPDEELLQLKEKVQSLEQQLKNNDLVNLNLQIQELKEENSRLLNSWEEECIKRGDVIAATWKQHLETVELNFAEIKEKLEFEIRDYEEKCNALVNENNELRKNVDAEIRSEVDKLSTLQKTITELSQTLQQRESQLMIVQTELEERDKKLESINMVIETTLKQFEEKREVVDEIVKILEKNTSWPLSFEKTAIVAEFQRQLENQTQQQQRIQDLESTISTLNRDLEFKTGEMANTFQMLSESKLKIEELTTAQTSFLNSLEEKNREISLLNEKLQHFDSLKNDNNREVHNLQKDLEECKNNCVVLQTSLSDTQKELFSTKEDYQEKLQELQQLYQEKCQTIDDLTQQLQYYSNKITEMENLLLEKQNDIDSLKIVNSGLQNDLDNFKEAHNNQIGQLNEYQQYCQEINNHLTERGQHCLELERQQSENNKEINDLKEIIESQVVKIEELKKDLFAKSRDFDSLIAEVDLTNAQNSGAITKQPVAMTDEVPKSQRTEELTDAVSRAELDLALYMLHQRDVRCEELTVELTQLLEERDTLQLRLSNAIREKEELRKRTLGFEEATTSQSVGTPQSSPSKSGAIFMAASGIEVGTEPTEDLNTKLSELKRVGYKKDKTFVDEQELRRLQQLAIMQEHIHEASKLPPEAAQKLVDASYTLSRDVQSPSKVLLNWLWGRSTPKVNDT